MLYAPPYRGINLQIAGSLVVWIGLTLFLWQKRTRYPWLAFAWATWLWLLFPVMNFFPITTLMNDRYMYLPCLVIFAILAEGCRRSVEIAAPVLVKNRVIPLTLSAVVIAGYFSAAWHCLPVFRDPGSLWSYAREKTPSLATVHIQWALTLRSLGKSQEAISSLETASEQQQFDPNDRKRIVTMITEWKAAE